MSARNTDPATSHLAAAANALIRAHDQREALLTHARHPTGLTDFELATIMRRQQTSAGKRRGELRDAGLIEGRHRVAVRRSFGGLPNSVDRLLPPSVSVRPSSIGTP